MNPAAVPPTAQPEGVEPGVFSPQWFALLLALLILSVFAGVVLGGESFYFRDFGIFGYPLAYYHRECFWRFEWPLWNPYNMCGLPFLAQWNTMALYPGTLIYLLLPLPWSLNIFCLAHLYLAGLGLYFLARLWTGRGLPAALAALAFAFSGLLLSSLKWPNNIAVLGWMPWVVMLAARAWREGRLQVLAAAGAGTMQMLAGTPELILLTWLVVGVLWLADLLRPVAPRSAMIRRIGAVVILVSAASAAQLLPFFDLLRHSQRGAEYGASSWAMPWWGLGNFIAPLFRCFRSHQGVFAQYNQYWISSYYVGLVAVMFAFWAVWKTRRKAVLASAAICAVCLWLALGEQGVIYEWLRRLFPIIGYMRFPIKFVVPAVFALSCLAALGMAEWERTEPLEMRRARMRLLVVGAVLAVLGCGLLWYAKASPMPRDDWTATWRNGLLRLVLLAAALGLWFAYHRAFESRFKTGLGLALMAIVALDGLTHAPWQNPTVPRWTLDPGLSELKPPPRLGASRAMISPFAENQLDHWAPPDPVKDYLASRLGLFCNCNLLDDMPKVDGFFSLYLRDTAGVVGLLYSSTNADFPALRQFLGVSQVTTPGKMAAWSAQANPGPLISAGQKPVFAAPAEILRNLALPGFDPRAVVYLPSGSEGAILVKNSASARVLWSRWEAHQIECEVTSDKPAWVVIANSFYHPWRAFVNGKASPIWRANLGFQAVEAPAGRTNLRLEYRDNAFGFGLAISGVTILACAAALLAGTRRQRRGNGAPPA